MPDSQIRECGKGMKRTFAVGFACWILASAANGAAHISLQGEIDVAAAWGGGRVVVPSGEHFMDGPLRLRSNVELHLSEGAVLVFTDNPSKYLPAVPSSWEGLECLNYSPLIYAYGCTNVAITGKGTLAPKMGRWARQMEREKATWTAEEKDSRYDIQAARGILYKWGSEDYPVEKRDITKAHPAVMRPQLIQFNRCRNVRIEDVRIRDCPFWTIHLFLSADVVVRGIDIRARGFNNDGIDIEMTKNVLVENCTFDQGDDVIVVKSGRNRDAWRLACPSENIEIRNCVVRGGHTLLAVGSEISGGVRNVSLHDCTVECPVLRLFYVKTNERRGGFIENIQMENVRAKAVEYGVLAVETDVLYQWAAFPTYKVCVTPIRRLSVRNVTVDSAERRVDLRGDPRLPVADVALENVSVHSVRCQDRIENVINVKDDMSDANGPGEVKHG